MTFPQYSSRKNENGTASYSIDGERWWPSLQGMLLNWSLNNEPEKLGMSKSQEWVDKMRKQEADMRESSQKIVDDFKESRRAR